MRSLLFSTLLLLASLPSLLNAQKLNPLYWKNRPPRADYWQQDVQYTIQATLIPDSNEVQGNLELVYTNNSPDTLQVLYFHLYQNAYSPGSYRDKLVTANYQKARYGPNESRHGGNAVRNLTVDGQPYEPEMDNTIMKVRLRKPLLPGRQATIRMGFSTWWDNGSEDRRMKVFTAQVRNSAGQEYTVKHFDGVHWYPRIAVYDRQFGWEIAQHLGKEFYGDFGQYTVSLTLPSEYVLDATGVLQNEAEVLPPALMQQLDLKQYATKPWDEPASEVIPPGQGQKTWHFVAENVHDFAWTADPTYRIGLAEWNGVRCVALAQEAHASGWQDAAEFTAKVIETYSTDIGAYAYPKMIVADAQDGMEYPMLTLDGGRSPGYKGLLAHEVGHNWFYGMVGTNETYRASMDEGFTQFLTAHCMSKLVGPMTVRNGEWSSTLYNNCYHSYLRDARSGHEGTLNTHSNEYHGALGHENGYRSVYHKTATMLYNLEYVLGKETFWGAMQHYFEKWRFAHPYPQDFRDAITEYCNCDLTWFFDPWMETHDVIDYSVEKVQNRNGKTYVTFARKGEMQMPLDFVAITKAKDTLRFTLPNTEYAKQEPGVTVLPKWLGYDVLNPTHTVELPSTSSPIRRVIIDPGLRLADVNRLNNQNGPTPLKMTFTLRPKADLSYPSWTRYHANLSPSIWYNGYSGLQAGALMRGSYMQTSGITTLGVWVATGLFTQPSRDAGLATTPDEWHRLSYRYQYETPVRRLGPDFKLQVQSAFQDGLHQHGLGFSKRWAEGREDHPDYKLIYARYRFLSRPFISWRDYQLYPERWTAGSTNAFVDLGFEKGYGVLGGRASLNVEVRSSAPGSDAGYGRIKLTHRHEAELGKAHLRYRLFGQYGSGSFPMESALYLAEGNPEEMQTNAFLRSRGFLPGALLDNDLGRQTYHTQFGGGLALRGYAGYLAEYPDLGPAWYGNSGAALNVEVEMNRFIGWRPRWFSDFMQAHLYGFYDAGMIARGIAQQGFDRPEWDVLRMDAGVGLAVDIHERHYLREGPLTLRFDVPFFVNRAPAREEFLQFRWVVGVGRAF